MSSPTQRSLKYLRDKGYTCDVSEHFNFFTKQRKDLFNFIDIVAVGNGHILAVQTTSTSNMSARVKKILGIDAAHAWVMNGGDITVHGWSKKGPRGKRKLWTLTEQIVAP